MKECSFFTCNYSHENYAGDDVCQYSEEPCDIPYTGKCTAVNPRGTEDMCKFCQRMLFCGLRKDGDNKCG